jgi:hypothetical protein
MAQERCGARRATLFVPHRHQEASLPMSVFAAVGLRVRSRASNRDQTPAAYHVVRQAMHERD